MGQQRAGHRQTQPLVPGFRLWLRDRVAVVVVAILALAMLTLPLWIRNTTRVLGGFGDMAAVVDTDISYVGFLIGYFFVLHFLFCNVFRVGPGLEFAWDIVFLALAALSIGEVLPWWAVVFPSGGLAIGVVIRATRDPSYHGAGWKWIKPGGPECWRRRVMIDSLAEALIHFTNIASSESIERSGILIGEMGIFAIRMLEERASRANRLERMLRTGLLWAETECHVKIPKDADKHFSRAPFSFGLMSWWSRTAKAECAPAGRINMKTGFHDPARTWFGPRVILYGGDVLVYLGVIFGLVILWRYLPRF